MNESIVEISNAKSIKCQVLLISNSVHFGTKHGIAAVYMVQKHLVGNIKY